MFDFAKKVLRKAKLFVIFFRRIVFVRNHFHVSFPAKVSANLGGGYLADQYALYGLKHQSRKAYLSEFDWYRSRYINAPFDFLLNNKLACTQILQQYARVPAIDLMKNHGIMSDFSGGVFQGAEALEKIRARGDVFFKPFGKGKGTGVCRITYRAGRYAVDGVPVTEEMLVRKLTEEEDWMLCESIRQGPFPASLYDQTVNTMRIITFRDVKTERFRIFFAVQRIGTKQTIPVDNGSRGGLVSEIDLETGTLSAARSIQFPGVFECHPDSGAEIRGRVIPGWTGLKQEVLRLSGKLPYLSFIAWDIVLTDGGFAVIEANTSSGVNIIQLWGGQRHGPLGDFYRHHGVKV